MMEDLISLLGKEVDELVEVSKHQNLYNKHVEITEYMLKLLNKPHKIYYLCILYGAYYYSNGLVTTCIISELSIKEEVFS